MSTSAPESESPVKRASDLAYTDRPATELNPSRPYSAIKFADLCELFEAVRGVNQTGLKGSERKRALLDAWHRTFCITEGPRTGAFDLYRLILPTVDKERATYKLKEAALAHCLGLALGLKRGHSPDFLKLEGWRKSGNGNFAQTVYDVCKGHRPPHLGDVRRATVGDVNAALDRLSELNNVKEKVPILRSLIDNMDAGQVRWLVAIIIKDLKLGGAVPAVGILYVSVQISRFQAFAFQTQRAPLQVGYGETPIMRHFHADAENLYNVCCDLRRVCETLHTKDERFKKQDLHPGRGCTPAECS
jgi:DNA ligase-4